MAIIFAAILFDWLTEWLTVREKSAQLQFEATFAGHSKLKAAIWKSHKRVSFQWESQCKRWPMNRQLDDFPSSLSWNFPSRSCEEIRRNFVLQACAKRAHASSDMWIMRMQRYYHYFKHTLFFLTFKNWQTNYYYHYRACSKHNDLSVEHWNIWIPLFLLLNLLNILEHPKKADLYRKECVCQKRSNDKVYKSSISIFLVSFIISNNNNFCISSSYFNV